MMNTYNLIFTKAKDKKEVRITKHVRIKKTCIVIPIYHALFAINDTNRKNVPEALLKDLDKAHKDYMEYTKFNAINTSPQALKHKRAAFDKYYLLNKEVFSLLDKKI